MKKTEELTNRVASTTLVYFVALVVAVLFSFIFPELRFVHPENVTYVTILQVFGLGLLAWGTILVSFSQKYRKHLYLPGTDTVCFDFYVGPYKYFRHATYMGLLILFFGLAALINSIPIAIVAIITAIVVHFTLVKKEDQLLLGECGDVYREYKKKVRI